MDDINEVQNIETVSEAPKQTKGIFSKNKEQE